jgi:hypothetical protein
MAFSIRLNQVQYTTILGTYIICKQDTLPSYFLVHNLTYANQRMNYIILNRRNKSVSFSCLDGLHCPAIFKKT